MKNYKLTISGAVFSLLLLLVTVTLELELFESVIGLLKELEAYEIDELILASLIFAIFALVEFIHKYRVQCMSKEKIKIYYAMLASTQHILNNFLNQMQLIKITAENTQGFDPQVLILYDQIIKNASAQIDALGKIESIDEASIEMAVFP